MRGPRLRLPARSLVVAVLALGAARTPAQVEKVEITERRPFAGGAAFGAIGAYEELRGMVHFALDPAAPPNQGVVDLGLAKQGPDGLVRARANLVVLQPLDPERRRLGLFEVSNRGGRASLGQFNRASGADPAGDGLLMQLGLTVVWVGWQWDVPDGGDRMKLWAPVVRGPDDAPITGPVRCDWTVDADAKTLELGHRGHVPYPVHEPESARHHLTWRDGRDAGRHEVSRDQWRFSADGRAIEIVDGVFAGGRIYELVYEGCDPVVTGLGLTALRDLGSFARHAAECPFPVRHTMAVGISQTGRFLRHFVHQGFNQDAEGRRVFDGMLVLTAGAGRGSFNHRFAQPSRDAHRYSAFYFPTDLFPFSAAGQTDPETGVTDGLLAGVPDAMRPRLLLVNTGYEYWGRAAALVHTSIDGERDLPDEPDVRVHHVAGAQHYPGASDRGNPIDLRATYRAMLAALVGWVDRDEAPPPSRVPRIADGGLVPVAALAKPAIPGLTWPRAAHFARRVDYGPDFAQRGIVTLEPPVSGAPFPALVPQVDGDGNERGGLRPWELRAPLGTFTPWSLRTGLPGGNGELQDFTGRFVPFPRDELRARYGDRDGYLRRLGEVTAAMVEERLLLPADAVLARRLGGALWDRAWGRD